MKKLYTPELIVQTVKDLDVRANKLSIDQINRIIDDGYAELATIVQAFSDEEIVPLAEYYETGEEKVTLDIQEDVNEIYDLYLTIEGKDPDIYMYGIEKIRDKRYIYRDNRYNGRVHIELGALNKEVDNAVLKYYYTPTHTNDNVYMDAQTWLAFKSTLAVALYDAVHDVTRNGQKRAEAIRRARAILPDLPEDANEPITGRIFNGLDV